MNRPTARGKLRMVSPRRTIGCTCMHRTGLRGLGRAYVDGFRWALDHGFDRIIQMDADFSHSPDYIPAMLEKVERVRRGRRITVRAGRGARRGMGSGPRAS